MSYSEDVKIDKYALDEEWEKQASLYAKYVEKHATSMLKRDKLKEKLDFIAAEINFKIRKNPERYDIEGRPTEGAISSKVILQPEYQAANEEYLTSKHEVEVIYGARVALEHKKKALQYITDMYINGLLGERSSVPEVVRRMTQDRVAERQQKILNNNKRIKRLSQKRKGAKDAKEKI